MRIRKTGAAVSFNVWTVERTWFWSLVFPDRHGGAIGAAASEAEAVEEAQAAIERMPQPRDERGIPHEPSNDEEMTLGFQNSKDSGFDMSCMLEGAAYDFASSRGERSSKMRTIGRSYNNLWQLRLQQYAMRVATA